MKKKLLLQVGTIIALFLIVVIVAIGFVIYIGSTTMFLNAKNEMIDRDLLRFRKYIEDIPAVSGILDYWRDYPGKIRNDNYTEEEISAKLDYLSLYSDGFTEEEFAAFPEALKCALSKDNYHLLCSTLNNEMNQLDYKSIYCMDIGAGREGYIYCNANGKDLTYSGSLGQHRNLDISRHPAIGKILSGIYSVTEYEIYNEPGGDSLYIGYVPVEANGAIKCVLCVEYDWTGFRRTLGDNFVLMILLGIFLLTILSFALLGFLRRTVITPITQMQRSMRRYMATKNSADVIEDMNLITANNELGLFAKDMSDLVVKIDAYISEIQHSHKARQKLTAEVMDALAKAIDAKDEYTNGHSERVAIYSKMIAKKLGMSAADQEKIYYMGLVHDIGKIGIPKTIINKTERLTDEEFELIQSHPKLGYEILVKIHSEPDLALGARWHHENYDGTGYPDGKKGEDIPFLVRIIAVADSYDAMTSNRSYRSYIPQSDARAEIEKNIGTQFDPEAARCMIEIIDADKHYSLHE